MKLAFKKAEIPEEWRHKPELRSFLGDTVAFIYAFKGVIPPEEWNHDPSIICDNKSTVAISLA